MTGNSTTTQPGNSVANNGRRPRTRAPKPVQLAAGKTKGPEKGKRRHPDRESRASQIAGMLAKLLAPV
jgi:hypothetical protein